MAVDMFLKLDGVEGESTDDKHKGEIEVASFSWGQTNSATRSAGGGAAAGKVAVQDFHFVTFTGIQSPVLLKATATGEHFKKATLTVRQAGEKQQVEFLKVTMEDVLISSYQVGGTGGEEVPTDQVSINFTKIEMAVTRQRADGSIG